MAKAKKSIAEQAAAAAVAAVTEAAAAENPDLIEAEGEDEELQDVLEGLRRFGDAARVSWELHREEPDDHAGYICKLTLEQLDLAHIKSRHGPGKYKIFARDARGQYIKGSHRSNIRISDDGAAAQPAPHAEESGLARVLSEQAARERESAAHRKELMMALIGPVVGACSTLGAALLARKPSIDMPALILALRPQGNSLTELTQAMANLKALQPENESQVDLALRLVDKFKDLPSGGGEEGGWLDLVRDVLKEGAPLAKAALESVAQRRAQTAPPQNVLGSQPGQLRFVPAPISTPPAKSAPASATSASSPVPPPPASSIQPHSPAPLPPSDPAAEAETEMILKIVEPWLRKKAADLEEWAASNMDVDLCAEMLLASIPKVYRTYVTPEQLTTWLTRADWWPILVMFHPPLQPYQAWIDDLRQEVLAAANEKSDPEAEERDDPA